MKGLSLNCVRVIWLIYSTQTAQLGTHRSHDDRPEPDQRPRLLRASPSAGGARAQALLDLRQRALEPDHGAVIWTPLILSNQ